MIKFWTFLTACCITAAVAVAQDSSTQKLYADSIAKVTHDSANGRRQLDTTGAHATRDTARPARRSFDSTLFSDSNIPTRSDYLASLERTFEVFNKAPVLIESFGRIQPISEHMVEDDSALAIIRSRLSGDERTLNLRNLQMFIVLLDQLTVDSKAYKKQLDQYDTSLLALKKDIRELRKDTLIRTIFRDSTLRESFKPQLQQLRTKFRLADSLIKTATASINNLKAHVSANIISVQELDNQADELVETLGPRVFSKERRYLWEPAPPRGNRAFSGQFKRTVADEKKIAGYYFSNTRSQRAMLLVCGIVFFLWVFYNFSSLRKLDKRSSIDEFDFRYVSPLPFLATLLFVLNIAPLFDLNAPAIYIESIQFLLMLVLTVIFWKRISRSLFWYWSMFVFLFLAFSFGRLLGLPIYLQRYWTLTVNLAACALSAVVWLHYRKELHNQRIITFSGILYFSFNALAIICNLFGRTTLMQILGNTAIYSFVQTMSLIIFVRLVTETFLLQIQASRIRKNYPDRFDWQGIAKSIRRFLSLLAIIIWIIVFATNLSIYDKLNDELTAFLTEQRAIGSFNYTLSGIILFLGIIGIAHLLQKYISFFFGDTGDDASFDNKGQRSRLLVTRLILLIAGFLIAIAASGLPVDRITVILGALGVGVGLGLQNIVNNFVSGIILIFDRPLRIGDTVEVGDKKGRVKEIGIRSSTLLTVEGAEVIIPNGDVLSHNIVNWTLSNNHIRMDVTLNLQKPFDPDQVRSTIQDVIKEHPNNLSAREPEVLINSLAGQKAEVKVYFWCQDINKTENTRSIIYSAVYNKLIEKGINIA